MRPYAEAETASRRTEASSQPLHAPQRSNDDKLTSTEQPRLGPRRTVFLRKSRGSGRIAASSRKRGKGKGGPNASAVTSKVQKTYQSPFSVPSEFSAQKKVDWSKENQFTIMESLVYLHYY